MKTQLEQAKILMSPHSLTHFEIRKYHQKQPKLNGEKNSINHLPKVKDGAYVTTLDEFRLIGTHWIALYVNVNRIENASIRFNDVWILL